MPRRAPIEDMAVLNNLFVLSFLGTLLVQTDLGHLISGVEEREGVERGG